MTTERIDILTPVGRLVQGSPFEPQTTDAEGRPLVIKNGPNAGQPRVDYFMAIAIPKTDPGYLDVWAKIHATAQRDFPTLFDAAGNCVNPKFAFKVIDGDSAVPNQKGILPNSREGFPGHWVLYFSSGFAPKCYKKTADGQALEQLTEPESVKRGYYIRIYGQVTGNGSQQQPGIYLNHRMLELVGYGEEIATGPQADTVFGATAPAAVLPAGASATPLALVGPPLAHPGAATAPVAATGPAAAPPAAGVAPAPDFLNPPPGTVPPAAPVAPAGPPVPAAAVPLSAAVAAPPATLAAQPPGSFGQPEPVYRTADGGLFTAAQLAGAGYTPEQIQALPVA